jgi:hypothetical protein
MMAATTHGMRIARIGRIAETVGTTESAGYAQKAWLDELPGAVFAFVTLAYIVTSLLSLV